MKNLSLLAEQFRRDIDAAHTDEKFDWKYDSFHTDRMKNFPGGCCDDTCDLFWHYLVTEHDIVLQQMNAFYQKGDTYHNWLETPDGLIVDLTGDQFKGRKVMCAEPYDGFYSRMRNRNEVPSYCILNSDRLKRDYEVIMGYMKWN